MDERMVLKILHEMGWTPRQGEPAVKTCPECGGEGWVEGIVGSYFSEGLGNYLPREEVRRCGLCGGTGMVEVEDDE